MNRCKGYCRKCASLNALSKTIKTQRQNYIDPSIYSYLFGLYLGDGYISKIPKWKIRLVLDKRYPLVLNEAIGHVTGNKVFWINRPGCWELCSYSYLLPKLFPQGLPRGKKHLRNIILEQWQQDWVYTHPVSLLKGFHSDGCYFKQHKR